MDGMGGGGRARTRLPEEVVEKQIPPDKLRVTAFPEMSTSPIKMCSIKSRKHCLPTQTNKRKAA